MHSSRVFVLPGLSSSFIEALLVLLLFAGSLSTVPVSVPAEKSLKDNGYFPLIFPEKDALPYTNASKVVKENVMSSMSRGSESYDMQHSNVSKADAAVDPDSDDGAVQSTTASGTPTESSTQSTATTSLNPNLSSSTEPVTTKSTVNVTAESTSAASTTSSTSATTTTATSTTTTTMPITMTTLTPTTESQPDPIAVSSTVAALIDNSDGMPTGIVALVTMITFAIVAVVAYISLIVWRRYLEYRYGNRELLVNDLEFDTNDLRHFEL